MAGSVLLMGDEGKDEVTEITVGKEQVEVKKVREKKREESYSSRVF